MPPAWGRLLGLAAGAGAGLPLAAPGGAGKCADAEDEADACVALRVGAPGRLVLPALGCSGFIRPTLGDRANTLLKLFSLFTSSSLKYCISSRTRRTSASFIFASSVSLLMRCRSSGLEGRLSKRACKSSSRLCSKAACSCCMRCTSPN